MQASPTPWFAPLDFWAQATRALYISIKTTFMRFSKLPLLTSWALFLFSFSLPSSGWSQSDGEPWRLDAVTCHEVGALMTFETNIESAGGESLVLLSGLPQDVEVSSAQILLPEGMALVSVTQEAPLPDMEGELTSARAANDAQRLAIDLEEALLSALDQERAFLEYNRTIGGGGEVLLVDDVEEMRHYVAQRHQELALDRVDLVSNLRVMREALVQSDQALAQLERKATTPLHALQLVLSGEGRGLLKVQVATQQAGWASSYDLSWEESEGVLKADRFALVVQNTGLDWDQVVLELRTGKPLGLAHVVPTRPVLRASSEASYKGYSANVAWVNSGLHDTGAREDVLSLSGAQASNWRMAAEGRVTVSGDGAAARIKLDTQRLEATPHWVASVQRGESALRTCQTASWMDANMLSGEGRIFQNNAMLGVMPVNMPPWGDSLTVELGMDQTIRIARELLRDDSGTRKWSGKRVVEQVRELTVHNARPTEAAIEVEEQLPLAMGWDIEVQATEGGMYDAATGKVVWPEVNMAPESTWTAQIRINIVVPRGQQLLGF